MSDPKPALSTPPLYVAPARGPFSGRGLLDLVILAALAIASALTALHYITAKETVKIDAPTGPLTHLDDPSPEVPLPAPAAAAPASPAPGDQPVEVQPAK